MLSVKFKFADMPNNSNWFSIYGVSILTGIGFTMSLFVGNLAFIENTQYIDGVKIGVLSGSLLSTVFGYFILLISAKNKMIKFKKLFYIIIFMISFFNTGNAKYDRSIF